MRTSIATISVAGTLDRKLEAIAGAGFDGVEIMDADLVASPSTPAEIRRRCDDLGLVVEIFQPIRDVVGIRPEVFGDAARRFRRKIGWARELGTDLVLLCSTVGPQSVGDDDLLVEQLSAVGDIAREAGIEVAYEALAWGTHVNRLEQAWGAVRMADHPNVGLGIDTFHIASAGDGPEALCGIPGEKMTFLQIADAPYLQMSILEWSRHHRCFPGQGALDLAGLVGVVLDAGYEGPLSLEVFSDRVREADPDLTARDALRSLYYLQDVLDRRSGAGGPALPPAEADVRAAYVEITGSDSVLRLVEGLGFTRSGSAAEDRRSWWRRGEASIVLDEVRQDVPARVTAVGVEVDEPEHLAQRAADLQWDVRGEAAHPRFTAPSGVRFEVHGRAGSPQDWRTAFGEAGASPDGWLGIDHLGTQLAAEDSDAEVSFYRQLFGMSAGPISEFPDPSGRLRSRDLRTPTGGMRAVSNIVVRRDRVEPRGVDQLAFSTSDLLGQVAAMRSAGVDLVRPPVNYYEDLAARFDLDPALLTRLQESGVFYDRDGSGGELLHAYTPLVDGSFYVELLERRGGYDGYGEGATPVRLALQAEPRSRFTSPSGAPAGRR